MGINGHLPLVMLPSLNKPKKTTTTKVNKISMLLLEEKRFRMGTGKKTDAQFKGNFNWLETEQKKKKTIQSPGYRRNIEENTKALFK